jgi:hypothetical protein
MTCKTCASYKRDGIGVRCAALDQYFSDPEGVCEYYQDTTQKPDPVDENQGELF